MSRVSGSKPFAGWFTKCSINRIFHPRRKKKECISTHSSKAALSENTNNSMLLWVKQSFLTSQLSRCSFELNWTCWKQTETHRQRNTLIMLISWWPPQPWISPLTFNDAVWLQFFSRTEQFLQKSCCRWRTMLLCTALETFLWLVVSHRAAPGQDWCHSLRLFLMLEMRHQCFY